MNIAAVFGGVGVGGGVDEEEESEGELWVGEKGVSSWLERVGKGGRGRGEVLEHRLGRRLLSGCWGC